MDNNIMHLNEDMQKLIKENMPISKTFISLACFYSIFSDSTRLKILTTLLLSEMCVNDLSQILNINQTTISHQLKILKTYNIVTSIRRNKFVFYKITDKFVNSIMISGVDFLINKKLA